MSADSIPAAQFFEVEDNAHVFGYSRDSPKANEDTEIVLLKDEPPVSSKRLAIRKEIAQKLRRLPRSFLACWQIFSLETGCRHACAFCSQEAGTTITSLTREGLEDLLSALLTVAIEHRSTDKRSPGSAEPLVGYRMTEYRSGIMKLYYDNDSGSSLLLRDAVVHLAANFGVKSRISMVGYPRQDESLQRMHERIVGQHSKDVDSVRFSFSGYPLGWRQNREDYIRDYVNMLRTWKPFVDQHRGKGRYHGAIVEFRMDLDIEVGDDPLEDEFMSGRHMVRFGPALLVSKEEREGKPSLNEVIGVEGRAAKFKDTPVEYYLFVSDELVRRGNWRAFAKTVIRRGNLPGSRREEVRTLDGHVYGARVGGLVRLANSDGPFYAFEATFQEDGFYQAFNVYPKSDTRRCSGLLEETRWCLNALLMYKRKLGIGRRDCFPGATWDHVRELVGEIGQQGESVRSYNSRAADYVETKIVPLITTYVKILKLAGYEPEFVFDPNFTYFSGPLYNMGRAEPLFRGLVSRPDEPLTAAEMREYYLTYQFTSPTKLAPVPMFFEGETPLPRITGTKVPRASYNQGAVVFERLNSLNALRPKSSLYISGLIGTLRK